MKLQYLRKAKGMTQTELAQVSGTTQQQIALIENGHSDPRLSTIEKIARALDLETRDLFFSRSEFIKLLNKIIKSDFKEKTLNLKNLNIHCGENHCIFAFDSNWEHVSLNLNKKLIEAKEGSK